MEILLDKIGKRFGFEWIFKNLSFQFTRPKKYAITGPNGSGKSTLLKIICGQSSPTFGQIHHKKDEKIVESNQVYQLFTMAAPYIDLIELFTLKEALLFQSQFISFQNKMDIQKLIGLLGMQKSADKPIQYFSSGMKQRVKLLLALCADRPVAILDEPSTNLDEEGINWYQNLIDEFCKEKLLLIASNVENDLIKCDETLSIPDFKKTKKSINLFF